MDHHLDVVDVKINELLTGGRKAKFSEEGAAIHVTGYKMMFVEDGQ